MNFNIFNIFKKPATKKKVVVGVVTCGKNSDRENACRDTWGNSLNKDPNVEVIYVTARKSLETEYLFDDKVNVLYCRCPDSYDALPQKTRIFCKWALDCDYEYIFKCDDDTYIFQNNFLKFINKELSSKDYVGHRVLPFYASGGGGYFLSKKSMEIISNSNLMDFGPEDKRVGEILEGEVEFIHDDRFQPWRRYWDLDSDGKRKIIPDIEKMNGFITAHLLRLPANTMYDFHNKVGRL